MKILLSVYFSILSFVVFNQDNSNSFISPKLIIVMGAGHYYHDYCSRNTSVFLELKDSTLIPFNEWSSFETRLDLAHAKINLSAGKYRLLLMEKQIDTIEIQVFNIDFNNQDTSLMVDFDLLKCCHKDIGHYLLFAKGTDSIINKECHNKSRIVEQAKQHQGHFKVITIRHDSCSDLTEMHRTATINTLLAVQANISADRLIHEQSDKVPIGLYHPYAVYKQGSYEECLLEQSCEIGVIIEYIK